MPDAHTTIITTIRGLLDRRGAVDVEVRPEADFFDDLELDSLEVAELSAVLEEELGNDPYSSGHTPRTVAEVAAFYTVVSG